MGGIEILEEISKRASVQLGLQLHQARALKPGDFAVIRLSRAKKPKVLAVEFYSVEEARPISV